MLTDAAIIITTFQEPYSVRRALEAIIPQAGGAEIIVVAPDEATQQAAAAFPGIRIVEDQQKGKPAALNLALAEVTRHLVILTDGDVVIAENALTALIRPFDDEQVGVVSGRPISINQRDTMLGYWSHLLTDAGAHAERVKRDIEGTFFVCSGYLYAFRRQLISTIPEDALAEDAVISHMIGSAGYQTRYAPQAEVYVTYPHTYDDWLRQKVRSAGGYAQPIIAQSPLRMRSFGHEAKGSFRALTYGRSLKEFIWTLLLFVARLHLWALIFWRVRVRKLPLSALWQRVETTKAVEDHC